MVKEYNFSRS